MDLKENATSVSDSRRHPWERARAALLWKMLKKEVMQASSYPFRVLDIGSGDLYQARMLVSKSGEIAVTALDEAYTEAVRHRLKHDIAGMNIRMIRSPEEIPGGITFQAVLMMDVIEHVADDKAFLKQWVANPSTGRETVFVITVPAYQYLFSYHDRFLGHFRRYNRKQLVSLCREAGLGVKQSGYLFFPLFLARNLQFLVHKILRIQKEPGSDLGEWKGPAWVARLIKKVLVVSSCRAMKLSRRGIIVPGLSAWAVAARNE
ncbi:MAG TPA: class I SAM-dependent methyltransferase [Bacteroidales bacterium]|nr:class I SAM-dependent methyltransferase [Bacteroidales bacterium]HSA43422.1 class I SAM-dependent methyltransferase [Bacteroidales bacterium]